jgi:hypothetical protein
MMIQAPDTKIWKYGLSIYNFNTISAESMTSVGHIISEELVMHKVREEWEFLTEFAEDAVYDTTILDAFEKIFTCFGDPGIRFADFDLHPDGYDESVFDKCLMDVIHDNPFKFKDEKIWWKLLTEAATTSATINAMLAKLDEIGYKPGRSAGG